MCLRIYKKTSVIMHLQIYPFIDGLEFICIGTYECENVKYCIVAVVNFDLVNRQPFTRMLPSIVETCVVIRELEKEEVIDIINQNKRAFALNNSDNVYNNFELVAIYDRQFYTALQNVLLLPDHLLSDGGVVEEEKSTQTTQDLCNDIANIAFDWHPTSDKHHG